MSHWVLVVILMLVLAAWYLTYTAARLDRLHVRLHGTFAALDAQLVRRAESAVELANSGVLDAATALLVADAAAESLEATALEENTSQREGIESNLTQALCLAVTPELVERVAGDAALSGLVTSQLVRAGTRVQLARTFHNDAVTDVQQVRRKQLVRTFRLAGHTPLPSTVDFNDELPPALVA